MPKTGYRKLAYISKDFSEEERSSILSSSRNLVFDSNNIFPLKNDCDVADLLLKAFKLFVLSPKGLTEMSYDSYKRAMVKAIEFMNTQEELDNDVIREMEIWELENPNVQPQSALCRKIKTLLKTVLQSSLFEMAEKKRLEIIINSFTPSKDADVKSHSLTSWFVENSPWLKKEMGDQFILLESPKRLMKSFQVTMASMLLFVLEARKEFTEHNEFLTLYNDIQISTHSFDQHKRILRLLAALFSTPEDRIKTLKSFIINECTPPHFANELNESIAKCKVGDELHNYNVLYKDLLHKKQCSPLLTPSHFTVNVSDTESQLLAFLCASLAIQPSDVYRLTRRHVAVKKNNNAIVSQLEIDYYKGRADRAYKPPTFLGASVVARAILSYLQNLPEEQDNLFSTTKQRNIYFVNPYCKKNQNYTNFQTLFAKMIMDNAEFSDLVEKEHKREGAGKIFIHALSCMYQVDIPDIQTYRFEKKKRKLLRKEYVDGVEKPLPSNFFKLTHIKNSSVYAHSDKYRDGDLVNQNSHSSLTEKLSYLTDDNQDWVNQVGRITRMVMQDIESKALQPMLEFVDSEAYEKSLITKIVQNTSSDNVRINQYGEAIQASTNKDFNHVIVFENEQTVITMLHYIDEAETYGKRIWEANKLFFESTLLINVEWMHSCISKFDPKLVRKSAIEYQRLKKLNVLPKLFQNEIRAGISI